MYKKH
jgi:hypothetical protein